MHFAVISGVFASFGSLFGKLSSEYEILLLRLLLFGIMILFNSFGWVFFIKALHSADSSLSATVVSTASNYIFSALFGFMFFNETTTLLWWTGMAFIISGLVLIVRNGQSVPKEIKDKLG